MTHWERIGEVELEKSGNRYTGRSRRYRWMRHDSEEARRCVTSFSPCSSLSPSSGSAAVVERITEPMKLALSILLAVCGLAVVTAIWARR